MSERKSRPPLLPAAIEPPPAPVTPSPAPMAADGAVKTGLAPIRYWVKEALLGLEVRGKLLAQIKTRDALHIHVAIEGRDAVLTGELEKLSNLAFAETLARSVNGVRQVSNRLTCA